MEDLFKEVEEKMVKGAAHLLDEFRTLRTGRASAAILDSVKVDYYGTPTPLKQVANLAVADATMITAQPFDISQVSEIEKAIMSAGLGLNPSNDGRIIRIPIPPLTEERRKELVKKAHAMAESSRNAIRGFRREGNDVLKKMEKDKEISQDDGKGGQDEMQKLHDRFIAQINESLASKEKDILAV